MGQPRILMCPPDYYGIEYEINPWMSRSRGSRAGRGPPAVAAALRHARRPGRAGRADDAAAGPARPGLHRQRRADLRRSLLQLALPPRGPRQGDRPTSTPGSPSTASRSSTCPRGCSSKGPATPSSAARRCSPATASAATCTAISGSAGARQAGAAAGAGQSALLSPRHLLLPAGARRGDLLPGRLRRYGRKVLETHVPKLHRRHGRRRPSASAATPWSWARRSSPTAAASSWPRSLAGARLHARGRRAGRVPQGRRQRQVPDAAARRRGSRALDLTKPDSPRSATISFQQ